MPTLADSIVSSSSRKLTIRARPDLEAVKERYQGRTYWVVKDPVGLQYFRFEEEVFAILQMLDGDSSLDEIAERYEAEFPPKTITVEELQNFIGMLHRSGLVLSDAPGQGWQLKERRDEKKKQERLAALTNLLAFRMRGFDPERLLNWLYPYVRWFFSPVATAAVLVLAVAALTLVIVQFDVFQSRLPSFNSFFAAQNWLALAATIIVTKGLHELGHGMSCKHFGGECHEMGIMFLVLTPCPYCNVSDSWMLPNRWHRAAIGAAGMYVEVVLASICTFIWWFTEPGPLHYFSLNVMFISSVSTIFVNANPLLQYDGYYILSDILEIPNLRQKSRSILHRNLQKWMLGLEMPEDPFLPKRHQGLFAFYTVAAFFYRWIVLLSILYFLNKVFEPYGLKIVGQMIALVSIYGMIFMPARAIWKFFRVPGRLYKVKRLRFYASLILVAAVVAAVLFIPFPLRVWAPFELEPYDADNVHVEVAGRLVEIGVEPGERVEQGDLIARLENTDLQLEIVQLEGERDSYRTQIDSLEEMRFGRAGEVAGQLNRLRERLASAEARLREKREDVARLTIEAPRDGVVIPPARVPERPGADEAQLGGWTGTPLNEKNLGTTLSPQGQESLLCQIGDPGKWEAVMVIDQYDARLLERGQEVRLMFEESAYHVFVTELTTLGSDELTTAPARLASTNGGPLAVQPEPDGTLTPLNTSYRATARVNDPYGMLRNGLIGRARIETPPRTLAWRIMRYLGRTFNFDI